MIVHVMPLFNCNQHCSYCYLPKSQDSIIMSLSTLEGRLNAISEAYDIERINIYGGEIGLLSDAYLNQLFSLCGKYVKHIQGITNLCRPDILNFSQVEWSISVNEERPNNDKVIQYLLYHDHKRITISQVVTPSVLRAGAKKALQRLSRLGKKVEFLRYCPSEQNTLWSQSNRMYEDFLIDVLRCYQEYPIEVQNVSDLMSCMDGTYNPFADSNIFILPSGSFSCIDYHEGKEYFSIIDSIEDISKFVDAEKKYYHEAECTSCKYWGRCYAEHLSKKKEGDSCCGLKKLLAYYEENIYQND